MLIDTHCHIDFSEFDADREQIIDFCKQKRIEYLIVPSIGQQNWHKVADLSVQYRQIKSAFGIHPWYVEQEHDWSLLERYLVHENCVAIGECGLDFYHGKEQQHQQLEVLQQQLMLAQRFQLPIILHVRKAHQQALQMLKQYPDVKGVIHGFSGSIELAQQYSQQGYYFGIGGVFTLSNADKIRNMLKQLPLERLLLETDAPDMKPEFVTGKRNTPLAIETLFHRLANLLTIKVDTLEAILEQNTQRLFF